MAKSGASYACLQIDVFSKWLVKIAFQQVALRLGNVLELLLVDDDGSEAVSVLAACRLQVNEEFLASIVA